MARTTEPALGIFKALAASGFLDDPNTVTRVVIDLRPGYLPEIHVRHVGDERLLDVVAALTAGAEVVTGG